MSDLFYKIRKYILHERRRYRPGVGNFWLNFRKDVLFRTIVIAVFLVVIIVVLLVLSITVFPDNFIKDMVVKNEPIAEYTPSPAPINTTPLETSTPEPTLALTPSPEVTITPEPTPEIIIGYITANSGLNVRAEASRDSADIGGVQKTDRIEIVAIEGDWYKIVYGAGFGYVHSKYVAIQETPTPSPESSPTATTSPNNSPTTTP